MGIVTCVVAVGRVVIVIATATAPARRWPDSRYPRPPLYAPQNVRFNTNIQLAKLVFYIRDSFVYYQSAGLVNSV